LFTVGDDEYVILGAGHEQLGPNTYRAVPFPRLVPGGTTLWLSR
jgi:hypothetical protein